ncbi:hypothetical protein IAT38_004849 [Cryptococcus sp. DSM 104549]
MRACFKILLSLTAASFLNFARAAVGTATVIPDTALPSPTVTDAQKQYVLSNDFVVTDVPTTREYTWDLMKVKGSPDGFERLLYTINGLFPGPPIEANQGDTIVVHVNNKLDEGQTIHWHGLLMNGTVFMDGVPGITQCPIPAGGSFTYRFTVDNQYGTFWYHSHYSNTMADGLWGPLIVHSVDEPLQRGRDYDVDQIVMVTDWMHDQSETIVNALLSDGGYRGTDAAPQGDSNLINGVGHNCSNTGGPSDCISPPPPVFLFPQNSVVRLRFICTSALNFLRISVDDHSLQVIETDSTAVAGPTVHEISISAGERISVLLNMTQHPSSFWMRVNTGIGCIPGGFPQTALGAVWYLEAASNGTAQLPTTSPWDDLASPNDPCVGMDEQYYLPPREAASTPKDAYQTSVMYSKRGVFVDVYGDQFTGFGFNNVTFQNQINHPLFATIQDGGSPNNTLITTVTYNEIGEATLILNNLDADIGHPFHLHGNDFMLIGRGDGQITADQLNAMSASELSLSNPTRKDTLWIQGNKWAALRTITNNPGVWSMHCHIGWHLAEGKLAAVIVQPEAITQSLRPADWTGLCAGTDPNAFGPARRSLSPIPDVLPSLREKRHSLIQQRRQEI